MHDDLAAAISKGQVILFAGSGTSAGLGAPLWSGLMDEIGGQLDYDPDVFRSLGASYLTVAEFYKIRKEALAPSAPGWITSGLSTMPHWTSRSARPYFSLGLPHNLHNQLRQKSRRDTPNTPSGLSQNIQHQEFG